MMRAMAKRSVLLGDKMCADATVVVFGKKLNVSGHSWW